MVKQNKFCHDRWALRVAGGALLIFLLAGCSSQGLIDNSNVIADEDATPFPTSAALAKPTYTTARGDVVGLSHFSGHITPIVEKELFFRISGRTHKIYFQKGDTVHTGQVLADLEGADDLQRQKTLNEIHIHRNEIYVSIAQLNLDYFLKTTSKSEHGYDEQLAILQRRLELAKLDLTEASFGSNELEISIADKLLVAPMDGELTAMKLKEGSEVEGFTTIATIADLSALEVTASLFSSNWSNLAVGMPAIIKSNGGGGRDATGVVRSLPSVDARGTSDENNPILHIQMDGSPTDLGYKMLDLVKVDVIVKKSLNALWVPPQVIRTFNNHSFVVVQDGNIQRRVDVTLGVVGDERVEILEGLTEGQIVVSP
jgi:membrane fusion protein, macrolide-specific efflux system